MNGNFLGRLNSYALLADPSRTTPALAWPDVHQNVIMEDKNCVISDDPFPIAVLRLLHNIAQENAQTKKV